MREALIGQNSCTGMHTGLETEWFIALSRLLGVELGKCNQAETYGEHIEFESLRILKMYY